MSGHSKWHSIKHKKGAVDAKRGKLFTRLTRAIIVAAREGGGNPDMNSALANAIQKAKENNMPADNIQRAIKRGTGELEGVSYEPVLYEGYGPSGVAVMVEALTDNRNRTAADIRNIFSRSGGNLAGSGSVAWMFDKKGVVLVPKQGAPDEDDLLGVVLEAGAEDMRSEDDQFEIVSAPADLSKVREALAASGIQFTSAEQMMMPKTTERLDAATAKKVLRLMDALEDQDDVQEVYANFDIPDDVMEQVAGE
ncbi:MAG: YebC/PmpR family DNA-binding transcriptional regulator [Actinobacteria bacterium]|nr:MAG: YebC/PmpR family DNA-binding transcriptional regulator [Actinomycetota bacterium]